MTPVEAGVFTSLEQPASDFLPEWQGDPVKETITLRQHLSMTTGLEGGEANLVRSLLARSERFFAANLPLAHEPGTFWTYNNPAYRLLFPIIEEATDSDLPEVFAERLFDPGGLMCFRVAREMSHRVAAIAPFIANSPKNRTNGAPEFPISMFICNGQGEEEFMPWAGGFVAANPAAGEVLSATATRDLRVGLTGVDPSPEVTPIPNLEAEGSTARRQLYTGGDDGAEVAFVVVVNGGHVIPSRDHRYSDASLSLFRLGIQNHDFEAFREAWAFLERQRLGTTRSPSFDEWMTANGFTDPAADPDGDGRSHAETYLGGSLAGPILSIEPSGDGVHLRLNRRETATGLSATVERSDDLHEWSRADGTLAIEAASRDEDGMVSLRLQESENPAAAAVFYRVELFPVE